MSVSNKLLKAAAGAATDTETLDIDQVFSSYAYDGNGYSQFIKNGIDLGSGPTDGVAFHLRGDSFTDSSPVPKTVINSNSVPRSTSESKFGGGSYDFSGTNGVLRIAQSEATDLRGDFCFEYWFKGSHSSGHTIGDASTNTGCEFYITSNQARMWINAGYISASITYNSSQWNHIAWCRKGDKVYAVVNGVKTSEDTFNGYLSGDWRLGGYYYSGSIYSYDDGYYEDFRLTVGDYRYTGNISVPTALQPTVEAGNAEGGLVWTKERTGTQDHTLFDTERGTNRINSNNTSAQFGDPDGLRAFHSNGYMIRDGGDVNASGDKYVSWTFRKAPRFFDVVSIDVADPEPTSVTVNHNLGQQVGMVIMKPYLHTYPPYVWHRSLGANYYMQLNSTSGKAYVGGSGFSSTSTTITIPGSFVHSGSNNGKCILYLWAHNNNDGQFGNNADQDCIKCGTYSGNGTDARTINLGFEAQWVMVKRSDGPTDWAVFDTMRGLHTRQVSSNYLEWNTSNAEASFHLFADSQGFMVDAGDYNSSGENYIYMAIRRGPLAAPTSVDDIFSIHNRDGEPFSSELNLGNTHVIDMVMSANRYDAATTYRFVTDRLRGSNIILYPSGNNADQTVSNYIQFDRSERNAIPTGGWGNNSGGSGADSVFWQWKRAPSWFDCVGYSGTGSAKTVGHNLTVPPEMMLIKMRSSTQNWAVYHKGLNGGTDPEDYALEFNSTSAEFNTATYFNDTAPTSTVFTVGNGGAVNSSGEKFIAYLFASVDGISKVGSFSHTNGSATDVNCGFSNGCRWVMLKRYNNTGSWIIFDSERGIVSGNDPFIKQDTTDNEVTSYDVIDNISQGFQVQSGFLATGSWIFYAIAA